MKLFLLSLFLPKRLKLPKNVAEYVQSLFLSGATPEAIGRAVDRMFNRKSFKYFMIPNEKGTGFEFGVADYEIDGLEYIRATLDQVGAIKNGYYVNNHPMVQKIAAAAASAPLPQGR